MRDNPFLSKILFIVLLFFILVVSGCTTYPPQPEVEVHPNPHPTPLNQTPMPPPEELPPLFIRHPGNLTFYFVNNSVIVVTPLDKTFLINAGKGVLQKLESLNITNISFVVITTTKQRNIYSLPEIVLKYDPLIYDNGLKINSVYYDLYNKYGRVEHLKKDLSMVFGGVTVKILVPYDKGRGFLTSYGANSLVVEVCYKNTTYLFAGDCNYDCEEALLPDLSKVEFLMASPLCDANSYDFLFKTKPSCIFTVDFSCGSEWFELFYVEEIKQSLVYTVG